MHDQECSKNQHNTDFKQTNYMACELCLNKAAFEKKKKQARKKLCNNIMTHDCWGSWFSSEEGTG